MAEKPISVIVTGTVEDRFNANAAIRRYIAEGFRDLGPERAQVREIAHGTLTRSNLRFEADLVLAVGGVAVDASDLHALRRAADRSGAALAFWVHDDPYEFDYAFRLRGLADIVFNTDRWATVHYAETPAFHLPLAGCPRTHLRRIDRDARRDLALFFCGYAYENRIAFLRGAADLLRRHRTHVCGAQWPSDLTFAHNHRMSPDVFADTAANALFTLNVGRDLNVANARLNLIASTPGPRTFEVALMGSAQLFVADGLEVLDYFAKDREIVLIEGVRDLGRWLERTRDDPDSILDIAARAQARALAEHTYRHRAETALGELARRGLLAERHVDRAPETRLPAPPARPPISAALLPMAAE